MNGTEGADVTGGASEQNKARKKAYNGPRWHISCINWSYPAAPQAVAYFIYDGRTFHKYFDTWPEAVKWVEATIRSLAK